MRICTKCGFKFFRMNSATEQSAHRARCIDAPPSQHEINKRAFLKRAMASRAAHATSKSQFGKRG